MWFETARAISTNTWSCNWLPRMHTSNQSPLPLCRILSLIEQLQKLVHAVSLNLAQPSEKPFAQKPHGAHCDHGSSAPWPTGRLWLVLWSHCECCRSKNDMCRFRVQRVSNNLAPQRHWPPARQEPGKFGDRDSGKAAGTCSHWLALRCPTLFSSPALPDPCQHIDISSQSC